MHFYNNWAREILHGQFAQPLAIYGLPGYAYLLANELPEDSRPKKFAKSIQMAAERCQAAGLRMRVPRPGLCTDNGAMVAALGAQLVAHGASPSALNLPADSALPITEVLV